MDSLREASKTAEEFLFIKLVKRKSQVNEENTTF